MNNFYQDKILPPRHCSNTILLSHHRIKRQSGYNLLENIYQVRRVINCYAI